MVTGSPSPSWKEKPCILGIDEAGRGPVLGLYNSHIFHGLLGYMMRSLCCFCWILEWRIVHMSSIVIISYCAGPMVYGCAYCPLDQKERISTLQFAGTSILPSLFFDLVTRGFTVNSINPIVTRTLYFTILKLDFLVCTISYFKLTT